jgi:hypothetical protein
VLLPTCVGASVFSVNAQEVTSNVHSRGVIVLKPVEESPPQPSPASDAIPSPAPPKAPQLPQPVIKSCPRPFAHPDVSLATTERFDRALRSHLQAKSGSVIVDIDVPFAVGAEAPPPLKPWLAEARSAGGLVTVDEYCQESRGFFAFLSKLFTGDGASRYAAVDSYDVILHVNGLDQLVTQIEFKPRVPK